MVFITSSKDFPAASSTAWIKRDLAAEKEQISSTHSGGKGSYRRRDPVGRDYLSTHVIDLLPRLKSWIKRDLAAEKEQISSTHSGGKGSYRRRDPVGRDYLSTHVIDLLPRLGQRRLINNLRRCRGT